MSDMHRFLEAIRKIESSGLDLVELLTVAEGLRVSGDVELGLVLYKFWLLANPTNPARYAVAFNCGIHTLERGDVQGAKAYLSQAITANPDFFPARLTLSSAHEISGDLEAAVRECQQILERLAGVTHPNIEMKVQALKNIARVRRSSDIAESVLRQAIEIDPGQHELIHHWISHRQSRCFEPLLEPVGRLSSRDLFRRMAPLTMAYHTDDPLPQLAVARTYSRWLERKGGEIGAVGEWLPPSEEKRERLRIGYLSSDFCQHAVGYLMMDVFGCHDRQRFEITVFNIGQRNDDPIQKRIVAQVDHWVDLRGGEDRQASAMILDRGIDILLDMNGHTNHQRPRLLGMKPAPIIANWLGYPGTMGSDHHNYIISDDFIIPPAMERFYSEKVLRLPCYQANHKLYPIPLVAAARTELGLPETGMVYCCFNGAAKITEPVFSRWMTILSSVPGSVLWLRGSPEEDFARRFRQEAEKRGVAPERLVFLSFRGNTEYLGCHRYADLFLDTFPYGAHTTGSDALRMGVPILTMTGRSFASRVAGSLSRAAGLPDLICDSPEQYLRLAIELGTDQEKLKAIRQKLQSSLPTSVLFDPQLLTRELEKLFDIMWSDYRSAQIHRPTIHDPSALAAFCPVN